MKKGKLWILLLATALLAACSCSNKDTSSSKKSNCGPTCPIKDLTVHVIR